MGTWYDLSQSGEALRLPGREVRRLLKQVPRDSRRDNQQSRTCRDGAIKREMRLMVYGVAVWRVCAEAASVGKIALRLSLKNCCACSSEPRQLLRCGLEQASRGRMHQMGHQLGSTSLAGGRFFQHQRAFLIFCPNMS